MKEIVAEHSRHVGLPRTLPQRDNVTTLRAADWLSLAAAPTFAFMAAFTGIPGGGGPRGDVLGRITYLGTEWDGSNVLADERLPSCALVEAHFSR
jgi:hypothetical protein